MPVMWGDNRVQTLTPPGVADERTRLMVETIAAVMLEEDVSACIVDWDNAPASMLPAMIIENSLQEFIEPGLPEARIRELGKQAFYLHSIKGFDFGVKHAFGLFGMTAQIRQWYKQDPQEHHNTHTLEVEIDAALFEDGDPLGDRVDRQINRLNDQMKRYSQDTALRLVSTARGKVHVGGYAQAGGLFTVFPIAPEPDPSEGPVYMGAHTHVSGRYTAHEVAA